MDNYRFAAVSKSEGLHRSAAAILTTLRMLTFRSPRSIFPMWLRSIPARSASDSCEIASCFLAARMAAPSLTRTSAYCSEDETLCIGQSSLYHLFMATVFTTHFHETENENGALLSEHRATAPTCI